jgi:septal ring factor EnvC (AmiA/AmiB activator)
MSADTGELPMKALFLTAAFLFLAPLTAFSQVQDCPTGLICLTQAQANAARDNALELAATKEKIAVLEDALKTKDESIAELQKTNGQNIADLKEAIKRTEVALAEKTGQLIAKEAELTRNTAIIQAMIPMLRKKKIGLINLF